MSQKRILVIDDEFPVRYLVEHRLRNNNYDVITAKDGPSGLEAVRKHRPDLVVLDILMPGMDGFQVCQEIRNDPAIAYTPVIFLTACVTGKHKMRAFKAGGSDYLVKPFETDELLAQINLNLQRSHIPETSEPVEPYGRVISLYSPKGGVGTTTLAIELADAIVTQEEQPVVLIDLDLPFGSVAPMLGLNNAPHIVSLLLMPHDAIDQQLILRHSQMCGDKLYIIPTPGALILHGQPPEPEGLEAVLETLVAAEFITVLDLGSTLSTLNLAALRLSDIVYVVTSGQPVANRLHNAFVASAPELGLDASRLLPVINELHGFQEGTELARPPIARIPHAAEESRTKLWQRHQGIQRLISIAV
jgi:DNA-binding response OmpR family regulator